MLGDGPYPPSLKARIASRLGHLDNQTSGKILASLGRGRLKHVIAAHLSETNNTAQLARAALARALSCEPDWIAVATQEEGFSWREM
jgi:phosphoribosyl 1,2-cyclic phosphodiesterase